MKNRRITRIIGITLILALLLIALPVLPVFAVSTITLSPTQGEIGDTITVLGSVTATHSEQIASIYFSPISLAVGADITTATTYKRVINAANIPTLEEDAANAGTFTATFAIPSTLPTSTDIRAGGTVGQNVTAGTYYAYLTINAGVGISAKATLTVSASAVATLDPLDPASGPAGTSGVLVTGSNFPASTTLVFQFDSATITPTSGHTATQSGGTFYSFITIPSTATAGAHIISVTAGASTASAYFTVTTVGTPTPPPSGTTSISLDPTFGSVNTTISISGSGFIASHAITITYDGVSVKETTSSGTGTFLTSFQAPGGQHGARTVIATDGTNPASANFTMESDSPFTPQPTRPYMSEAISSPFTFNWEDVTDNSSPVTYNLQIATGNFTADTIIINKVGIAASQYTLNEADELKLSQGVTYYWRIKSVDAALNESLWSGSSEFSLSQGFQFPTWAWWLIGIFGGLFLFALGIWVGRKTAFNY